MNITQLFNPISPKYNKTHMLYVMMFITLLTMVLPIPSFMMLVLWSAFFVFTLSLVPNFQMMNLWSNTEALLTPWNLKQRSEIKLHIEMVQTLSIFSILGFIIYSLMLVAQ